MKFTIALVAALAELAGCSAEKGYQLSREQVIAEYRAMFKTWDKDHDGRLSPAESRAMVDHLIASEARQMPTANKAQFQTQRVRLLHDIAIEDANHDGYLTLADLLARPLAIFDCADRNHDGSLTETEIAIRMNQCSVTEEHKGPLAGPLDQGMAMPLRRTNRRGS